MELNKDTPGVKIIDGRVEIDFVEVTNDFNVQINAEQVAAQLERDRRSGALALRQAFTSVALLAHAEIRENQELIDHRGSLFGDGKIVG